MIRSSYKLKNILYYRGWLGCIYNFMHTNHNFNIFVTIDAIAVYFNPHAYTNNKCSGSVERN